VVVFLSPSCGPCIDLVPGLNKIAESRPDVPIVAVVTPGKGFPYATELSSRIMMVADNKREFLDAFAVRRTPLVYVIDDTGRVAMSSVANDLIDLEDTLNGSVRHQGNSPWVPVKN
jgi:thiol-disulfide isomerase/thioredoxin